MTPHHNRERYRVVPLPGSDYVASTTWTESGKRFEGHGKGPLTHAILCARMELQERLDLWREALSPSGVELPIGEVTSQASLSNDRLTRLLGRHPRARLVLCVAFRAVDG